jgi:isopentenyldiphosphate isomerase
MEEVILVDEQGESVGTMEKMQAHRRLNEEMGFDCAPNSC